MFWELGNSHIMNACQGHRGVCARTGSPLLCASTGIIAASQGNGLAGA
jgi:hypothetical protein